MRANRTALLVTALAALAALVGLITVGAAATALAIGLSLLTSTAAYRSRSRASLRGLGGRALEWYEAPELYGLVDVLARRAGLRQPRIYLMPGGMVNAVTVATASSSAIGVTEPLLQHLPPAEVAAVIAHEIAHIRNKDLGLAAVAMGLAGAAVVLAEFGRLGVILGWLAGFPVGPAELLGALLVAWGVPGTAFALRMAISREREFLADAGAAELVGSADLMARALWRLDQLNRGPWWWRFFGLGGPEEPTGLARLFSSHPPTSERIARLMARARYERPGPEACRTMMW